MAEYVPSQRFTNVNTLLSNHFKFAIEGLPDLTMFAQGVNLPGVDVAIIPQANPFVTIPQVGDHLRFGPLHVSYMFDNAFKTYFSVFAWLRGYGFPESYEQLEAFRLARVQQIANPRPAPQDIVKTNATLFILQPDNDTTIAEVLFFDVFPTGLSEVSFKTVEGEPTAIHCTVAFAYTDFDVRLA